MRLWVGIALTGVVLLTLATSFAASASADERGGEPDGGRGGERTAGPTPTPSTPPREGESARGNEAEAESGDDAEEQRVARWRIVDQPTTRWEGRGSERLARTGTGGEVVPVLPLGAGLTCVGLGIGLFGYRLRRA
ncbi:hypothetical protein [Streptomyces sedi]|uniref:LPXTG cell wall anchor domain-containing protein n=1 Tax=Streptomyces sedi TaxID=555059 RepID=A0A5C4V3I5_9ACTN|nr:hypothetical protein [Streptomyces sedi]TNM30298.1 hypothetical protein FH715_13210 [Streptomyces sedi]